MYWLHGTQFSRVFANTQRISHGLNNVVQPSDFFCFSVFVADRCQNVPDFDWAESVNSYLRKIPDTITLPGPAISLIPEIKIGPLKVTGLGDLWSYKPPTSFCAGNTTFVDAHVFAHKPLRFYVDWKTCSGQQGKFGIRVSSNNLRLVFVGLDENNKGMWLFKLFPESLEDPALLLDGGNEFLRTAASISNIIIMPHIELLWSMFLRRDARYLIRQNVGISIPQNV